MYEGITEQVKNVTSRYKIEEVIHIFSKVLNERMYQNNTMSEVGKYNFMNLAADMLVDEYVKYTTDRLEAEARERAKEKVIKYDFTNKRYR